MTSPVTPPAQLEILWPILTHLHTLVNSRGAILKKIVLVVVNYYNPSAIDKNHFFLVHKMIYIWMTKESIAV